VDLWRNPKKIFPSHPNNQFADFARNTWDAHIASYHAIDISRTRTSRYAASARPSPAEQSLTLPTRAATTATAGSGTADPTRESRDVEFCYARAPQSDGAARAVFRKNSVQVTVRDGPAKRRDTGHVFAFYVKALWPRPAGEMVPVGRARVPCVRPPKVAEATFARTYSSVHDPTRCHSF